MKKKASPMLVVISLVLLANVWILGQTTSNQSPNPSPTPPDENSEVVKITTKLVQFDAVVTDKDGNQIKDLSIGDFEILQDGKPQKITNFSYVNSEALTESSPKTIVKNGKNVILPPPVRVSPANLGRIITFIVDDGNCAASLSGMRAAQDALKKFVSEQMQPNDLVAIYQTRGGSSLLQQYTSDKNQLMRVARQIRWFPAPGCGNYGGDVFEPARTDSTLKDTGQRNFETEDNRKSRERNEDVIRDNKTVGTLGVIRYVVNGLEKVSGRKVVFFLSDGLPVRMRAGNSREALDVLRSLTDLANRASVVFNTIDVRGLVNPSMMNANDDVIVGDYDPDPAKPNGTDRISADRTTELSNSRDGLFYLASETGGRFYKDQNNLDVPINKALNSEKGYYLIGYEPEDGTFKDKNFNKIEIRLKRPDLKVRSRAGFMGKTDEELAPKKRTGDSELYDAIIAPLPRAGLNLQLTAFFVNSSTDGNVVRALVHLNGNEITFTDEPNGFKKAVFDVVAVTLNEKNEVVDEFNRTHIFKIEAAAVPLIRQNGIIYTTDVQVKKAGNYNFRLAVRDTNSKMLGSAGQVVQIPDLKKSKLFISGLTISTVDEKGKFISPSAVKPDNALSLTASSAVPAIRIFRANSIAAYSYTLYNAETDKASNQPKISIQVNLYQNGKLILEGKPQAGEFREQTDLKRINDYGYLRLNSAIAKGDYTLQVIATDLLTKEATSQWVDFEIIN